MQIGWTGFGDLLIGVYKNESLRIQSCIVDTMGRIPGVRVKRFLKQIAITPTDDENLQWSAVNSLAGGFPHHSPELTEFFFELLDTPGFPEDAYQTALYGVSHSLPMEDEYTDLHRSWIERGKHSKYYEDESLKPFLRF